MYKRPHLWWLLPLWVFVFCVAPEDEEQERVNSMAMEKRPVLIELFTSEGCSSCPPADRLLEKIAAENNADVYVLSFHVDYWNYIGWKDPFSQARFSDRQRNYARQFSLESIYTPQVVVNGITEFVGSDEQRLRAAIAKNSSLLPVRIEATRKNNTTVHLSCSWQSTEPLLLHVALVQKKATTAVKRGENSGKTLHHVNVVQQLKAVDAISGTGTVEIEFPTGVKETDYQLIVFTQNKKNRSIEGAGQTEVPPAQQ
jgi:hypothetical protein